MVRSICYVQFRAFLRYGIICWGRNNEIYVIYITTKGVTQIISGISNYTSRRQIFKDYNVFTVACLCIHGVVCYFKGYKDSLLVNVQIHN